MECNSTTARKTMNKKITHMLIALALITGTSANCAEKTKVTGSTGVCPAGNTLSTWGKNLNHNYTTNPVHVCHWYMAGDCHPYFHHISLNVSGYITKDSEKIPVSGLATLGSQHWRTDEGKSYLYYQLNPSKSTGLDGPTPTCTYTVCTSDRPCDGSPGTCVASPPCGWSPGEVTLLTENKGICGGKEYDPNSQACCNGKVYETATQACCNNKAEVVEGVTEVIVPIDRACVTSFFQDGCNGYLESAFSDDFKILAKPYNNSTAMQFVFQQAVCPGKHVKLLADPGGDCDFALNIEFTYPPAEGGIIKLKPNGYSRYRMQCSCDVELGCRFHPHKEKMTPVPWRR
jgi:hypothetical protein